MITARSPLRLEFLGGSTDLKNYYSLHEGRVLNVTLNKYIGVKVVKLSGDSFRIKTKDGVQVVKNIEKIKNVLVRENLKYFKVKNPVDLEITSDIHQFGSGLGSSSALTCALSKALSIYVKKTLNKRKLAETACEIEIDIVGSPIGKQDQYATVYGGLKLYRFRYDGFVSEQELGLSDEFFKKLENSIMILDTGDSHSSSSILDEQNKNIEKNLPFLNRMANLVLEGVDALKNENLKKFAEVLYKEWSVKKNLNKGIVNENLESIYKKALSAGAWGGRVSGAGGGGFMLLVVPVEEQKSVRNALSAYKELNYKFTRKGTEAVT